MTGLLVFNILCVELFGSSKEEARSIIFIFLPPQAVLNCLYAISCFNINISQVERMDIYHLHKKTLNSTWKIK